MPTRQCHTSFAPADLEPRRSRPPPARFSSVRARAPTHCSDAAGPAQPPALPSSRTRARSRRWQPPPSTPLRLNRPRLPPAAAAATPLATPSTVVRVVCHHWRTVSPALVSVAVCHLLLRLPATAAGHGRRRTASPRHGPPRPPALPPPISSVVPVPVRVCRSRWHTPAEEVRQDRCDLCG